MKTTYGLLNHQFKSIQQTVNNMELQDNPIEDINFFPVVLKEKKYISFSFLKWKRALRRKELDPCRRGVERDRGGEWTGAHGRRHWGSGMDINGEFAGDTWPPGSTSSCSHLLR